MPKRKEELQDYLARWGAKAVPFSDAMGSSIFSTPDSEEALVLLDETAALRATMVLYGDNGVGKSLLIRSWLPTLDPKRYRPVVITHATLTGIGLMASLLLKLGCPVSHLRSRNLATLEEAVTQMGRQIPVLVLDEAQLYSHDALEEVRLLLGLSLPAQPLFALILVGDNYLLDTLRLQSRKALYSRIAYSFQLLPLEPASAEKYLAQQLADVGITRSCFDEPALQMLITAADGIPRTLNLVARAAWIEASRVHADMINPDHLRSAIHRVPGARDKLETR